MITIIALSAAILAIPLMARLLVAAIATLLGAALVIRSRRNAGDILSRGIGQRNSRCDRKPSRAERRLLKQGLKLALDQAELKSLFPTTVARAETWANRLVP
ncbi:hypothetical protein [Sphingomonas sp.]|jgi:hypothetical protein|uniref:hypothetical protein n=1 Tax=Sphingomonas sp. TaxID=28214 RepID=UPI003F6ECB49